MKDAMKIVPASETVDTGVEDVKPVAQGLSEALADTYRLVFKTHAYHWNVEGALFHPIHKLTEAQYTEMFAAADEIAERIRALGQLAPARLSEVIDASVVEDAKKLPSAQAMVEDLATDHAAVAKRMHALISLAEEHDDPVTADLITARSAFHEKAAWMLRATAK
ncbi:DNA starvation/stationary phase protection protein [Paenirhodobacter sp. CAU 1674]|jgi:starvation-inducible DNA-binding protein|uniref:Dps family protein n=1 Tax=Paenirhodobacter sp. CAU 1674 TaxID=3032596 RepID=UPI0023DA7A1D|nr:DNA starvation/stationary phase protection protein [Paenirhodobacter sp. CAU 1674]MDF2142886.1 DNA starvation/stationary phase protection protein [Paenirhodobacter sp. CAU 1674]